jgi:dTDP-L-rhamnose 4-epimerase
MKPKVLITGGAGFIGNKTAAKLVVEGYDVRILDNLSRQVHPDPKESMARLHPAVEFVCGDIRDRSVLLAAMEGVEVVYHFAAETGVGQSMYEIERYSDVNIRGTAMLCDCIAQRPGSIKRIILASSRAVYGEGHYKCCSCGPVCPSARTPAQLETGRWNPVCPHCHGEISPIPCKETTPGMPVSIYGVTKKTQEELLSIISAAYKIPVIILRYFNVFGPGQSVSNPYTGVLSIFCSCMLSGQSIEIYEDGGMQRDFVPVQEVVNANVKAIHLNVSGVLVLNVGSGVPRTIMQLAQCLKAYINRGSIITTTGRYRIGDVRHSFADTSRADNFIGQVSDESLEQGIRDLVTWSAGRKTALKLNQSIEELAKLGLTGVPHKFNGIARTA